MTRLELELARGLCGVLVEEMGSVEVPGPRVRDAAVVVGRGGARRLEAADGGGWRERFEVGRGGGGMRVEVGVGARLELADGTVGSIRAGVVAL